MEGFSQTLADSLRDAVGPFMAVIPKVIGFLVILVIGWVVAALVARGVAALLRTIKFNELSNRAGFSNAVQKMGVRSDAASFIGLTVKWFIRLIALVVAFDALGLPAVSDILHRLLLWLPNVAVALVVLVIGGLAATALSGIVRGTSAKAGSGNPDLLAAVARVTVWAFAIVVAVNQIGIATSLVNTLFMATIGSIALALGLAFGLGGRETAGEIVRRWYVRSQEAAPRLQRAAKAVEDETTRHH